MSILRPFNAIRPKEEFAAKVAALPYDVMNSREAAEMTKGNPYSFLHVDKAEIDLPEGTDLYSDEVYAKAAQNLAALSENGICIQEETPCLYLYRQVMNGRPQTGIVGCASIDDYLNNVIKKHEHTRADKEADRICHVDVCNANTGPIFLCYSRNAAVDGIIDRYLATEPLYDFTTTDGIRNTVWKIADRADIDILTESFAKIPALYIADGHHRCASAVKVGLQRRAENPEYTGEEEFNFFLAVCFRADELEIFDYNRLLKDTNGLTEDELLARLSVIFTIEEEKQAYKPVARHNFGLYLNKKWYSLTLKDGICDENDPVASLDVSVLQDYCIDPVFDIEDPRTSERIDFVGGIRGLEELERRCEEDAVCAFSMYPTSLEELMRIADAGEIMPPKSTWFEPKLLSGLFIHKLSD